MSRDFCALSPTFGKFAGVGVLTAGRAAGVSTVRKEAQAALEERWASELAQVNAILQAPDGTPPERIEEMWRELDALQGESPLVHVHVGQVRDGQEYALALGQPIPVGRCHGVPAHVDQPRVANMRPHLHPRLERL